MRMPCSTLVGLRGFGLLIAFGATAAFVAHACPAAETGVTLARFVPADAGLCVEVTDLARHWDTFRHSPLGTRLQDFPPLRQFLTDNQAAVDALANELRDQTGLSPHDLLHDLLGHRLAVAVWPGTAADPDATGPALALVECQKSQVLDQVVARLLAAERAAGRRVVTTRWKGADRSCAIYRIETSREQPSLYLTTIDQLGIVATSDKLVAQVLELHAGNKEVASLAERESFQAATERLNPQAAVRAFVDPPAWKSTIAAQRGLSGDLAATAGSWLSSCFEDSDYLALSCQIGEQIVVEGFLHRREAPSVARIDQERDNQPTLAERLPAGAVAAFAGRIDLPRLLATLFREGADAKPSADEQNVAMHKHVALRALSALVAERGRDAVAALVPCKEDVNAQAPSSAKVDWIVGFDTHSLLADDRLALGQRLEPILRGGLTAAIMMYNRQGATMTIESAEEDGVPLTSVGGLALMGQGSTATFSLVNDYFWAGTSRDAVRETARLDRAQSLAENARYQALENPRLARPSHLAYLDLAAVRRLFTAGSDADKPAEHSGRASDLAEITALADRLLIELQIDEAGIAVSATVVADDAP
ncbi:MAG TPA: hypothetical protein VHD36_24025 [Pirellulales bacterium]|nr:hypothetical protein [Pirellulales bacterium]